MEKVMSTVEAAKKIGVTPVAVWQWIKAGKVEAVKVGKTYVLTEREVKRIIALRKSGLWRLK